MGKIKSALSTAGKVLDAMATRNNQIDQMTNELMRRSYGVDADQARKLAAVLVDHADVTWK